MRIRVASFVAALSAWGAACALAADADLVERLQRRVTRDASGQFYSLRYGRYVIRSNIDARFTAEAAVYMHKFYVAFRSFFRPKPKLRATPTVYFFKDRETYRAYCRKRGFSKRLINAGGFYRMRGGRSELFCWHKRPGTGFRGFPKEVIRHEGAHQLLRYIVGSRRIPVWYDEGVATFFETWDVERPREWNLERARRWHTRFPIIRRTYGTPAFKSLHDLVGLNHKTWVPDDFGAVTAQHYAEVQSFMTFLLVTEKGRKFFAVLFRHIARGRDVALGRKVVESAQRAWYEDIERRIEAAKKAPPLSGRPR